MFTFFRNLLYSLKNNPVNFIVKHQKLSNSLKLDTNVHQKHFFAEFIFFFYKYSVLPLCLIKVAAFRAGVDVNMDLARLPILKGNGPFYILS